MKSMAPFGQQLRYAQSVLEAKRRPVVAGENDKRALLAREYSRVVMQVVVSLLMIAGGFYLLIKPGNDQMQKFATGILGTVVGYWLR
jgi:hypothetical protein